MVQSGASALERQSIIHTPMNLLPPKSDRYFRTDHLIDDLKGRAVRGITVTLGAQGVKFLIALGSTMILARLLSPTDYGLLAMVAVITGFVAVLRDGGLSIATIQRADISAAQVSTLFWINVTLGTGLALFVAAISPAVAWFYDQPSLKWVTVAMGIPFILSGLTVQHQALLQRQMRFGVIAVIEVTSLVLSAGVGIIAAARGWGYWALVIMANAFSLSILVLVLWFCRWIPGRPVRHSGVRSMLRFGGVLTANNLFNSFGGSADKLLLGKFYAAGIVGLYTRAQTLMLQPLIQFMPAVQNVVVPVLSRLAAKPQSLRAVFINLLEVTAFACSFMTVFLVVNADWLVWVFLGPKWMEAADILRLMAGPAFVIPLNALCVISLTVQSKSGSLLRWGLVNNAITVLAILAGLSWGPVGVAAALSIAALSILTPLLIYMTAKAGPASLKDAWYAVLPAVGACLLGCGILFFSRRAIGLHNPLLGLPVLFLINCVFHACSLAILPSGRRTVRSVRAVISSVPFMRTKAGVTAKPILMGNEMPLP
jgi:O-antigen/teichoic acid export membrane protein